MPTSMHVLIAAMIIGSIVEVDLMVVSCEIDPTLHLTVTVSPADTITTEEGPV